MARPQRRQGQRGGGVAGDHHQIRRHLKHIAHPVIGDATHGKGRHNRLFQELFGSHRLLLACLKMQLTHPVSGEPLLLNAPLSEDFTDVIEALGWKIPTTSLRQTHTDIE